jgi:hypothetical protein
MDAQNLALALIIVESDDSMVPGNAKHRVPFILTQLWVIIQCSTAPTQLICTYCTNLTNDDVEKEPFHNLQLLDKYLE